MAKYWTASMQYSQMSVEELQKKAQESVKNAKNKGKEMHPIIVDGRQIAKSWWGMAWCKNIEQYADYASRIERGKRYVRSGAVVDLQIVKGKVKARVQGTRKTPYKVEINISPLKEEVCEVLSDEEIERRARNKALRELGPKQEEACPIDIVSVGETEV